MNVASRWCIVLVLVGLTACTQPSQQADGRGGAEIPATRFLSDESEAGGYAQVLSPRPFQFPEDHGSHPEYRTEWWYFTGNLTGPDSRHFGFELTFFRYALTADAPERNSAWAANQAWMAHLALTDTHGDRFVADERFSRGALGLAGTQRDPFRVWVEDWSASAEGPELLPIRLQASNEEVSLDLTLTGSKPPVTHGDDGMDRKGPEPGNASYYYSLTRLHATGSVRVGRREAAVSGLAWMDREWGTSALSDDLEGWDWFSVQLSDETELMYYRLRRRDGSASPHSGGSIVDVDGNRRGLSASAVSLTPLDYWESPTSQRRYPVAWRLELPDEDFTLEIEPYLPQQELDLTVRYWEGAIRATGSRGGQPIAGSGYLELAGY